MITAQFVAASKGNESNLADINEADHGMTYMLTTPVHVLAERLLIRRIRDWSYTRRGESRNQGT